MGAWLDHQEQFSASLDDRRFLAHLPSTLELLNRPGPVAEVLEDLRLAYERQVHEFIVAQQAALEVAEDWAETWEMQGTPRFAFETLRGQIQKIKPDEVQLGPDGRITVTATSRAINDLDRAAMTAVETDGGLGRLLDNFREDVYGFRHAVQAHALAHQTAAQFALARLEVVAEHINPSVYPTSAYPRVIGIGGQIDALVYGNEPPESLTPTLRELIAQSRADLARLYLEIRRRSDVGRSRASTVRRFATWASLYGRDELRQVAEDSMGSVEDALTLRLAWFLFDHGHTPISQPLLGRVKPDLLDPIALDRLYVEAKQFSDPSRASAVIAQGLRQTADTATLLAGTPVALEEAFVVIFALDGPRIDLPDHVRVAGITIHLVVVDLVPWEKIGSRRREQPLRITEDDLIS